MLYHLQSGFRQKYSTDTCLIYLLDYLRTNNAKGLYTGMIMLDLQKAFDTVDHNILCSKLKVMGVQSVDWFESYLTDRVQFVSVNSTISEPMNVSCGVSQGSIMGSLLFFTYVNDMSISIDGDCKLILYADDSAILYIHIKILILYVLNFSTPNTNLCSTNSFSYNAIGDWNSLPISIKNVNNKEAFKNAVKEFF